MKVYIIGSVASGKTTLAGKMSKSLGIPHYELDSIVYMETGNGQYKRTPEQQVEEIHRIDQVGDWIIEGTYRVNNHCLLDLADKVVFLDPPLWKRKIRIVTRFCRQRLGLEVCHYRPNLHMLKMMYRWTNEFEKNRLGFEERLNGYRVKLILTLDNKESNS